GRLDDARVAAPLAGAGDVHPLDLVEQVDGEGLPLGHLGRAVLADLADITLGLGVDLAGVAALGLRGVLPLLVIEAELQRVVPVALLGPDLEDHAGAAFQDGHGQYDPVLLVDLGHADFAAEKSHSHRSNSVAGTHEPAGGSAPARVPPAPGGCRRRTWVKR